MHGHCAICMRQSEGLFLGGYQQPGFDSCWKLDQQLVALHSELFWCTAQLLPFLLQQKSPPCLGSHHSELPEGYLD